MVESGGEDERIGAEGKGVERGVVKQLDVAGAGVREGEDAGGEVIEEVTTGESGGSEVGRGGEERGVEIGDNGTVEGRGRDKGGREEGRLRG